MRPVSHKGCRSPAFRLRTGRVAWWLGRVQGKSSGSGRVVVNRAVIATASPVIAWLRRNGAFVLLTFWWSHMPMSWENPGRQEHGCFGNGTAPPKYQDNASDADSDLVGPTQTSQRMAAVAYGAIAALPPGVRAQAAARSDPATRARLTEVMSAWASAAKLDQSGFADQFLWTSSLAAISCRRPGSGERSSTNRGCRKFAPAVGTVWAPSNRPQERQRQPDRRQPWPVSGRPTIRRTAVGNARRRTCAVRRQRSRCGAGALPR